MLLVDSTTGNEPNYLWAATWSSSIKRWPLNSVELSNDKCKDISDAEKLTKNDSNASQQNQPQATLSKSDLILPGKLI